MSADLEANIFAELDEIDNLPAPGRPVSPPLAAVQIVWVCTHAAEQARDEIADDKGRGLAHCTLVEIVAGMSPREDTDETEDAWYRRGAISGGIAAFENLIYVEPKDAPSFAHAALHANGWLLANFVTKEVLHG